MKMPMAIGMIHGGRVRMRKIVRPGTAALSSTAPQVPMTIFSATEQNVQMNVRMMTEAKSAPKIFW